MIALLREEEPDPEGWLLLSLSRLNQRLLDADHESLPETLLNILKSIAGMEKVWQAVREALNSSIICMASIGLNFRGPGKI